MSNIKNAFQNKALIGFVMAGDPELETTKEVIISMANAGVDMVELGIPFSDPIAESSVIQSANLRALKSETYLPRIFEMIKEVRKTTDISIIFHTYINPVFNYGYEEFFQMCKETQVGGVVIPDLPFEEKQEIKEYADKNEVDIISFVVPTDGARIKMIAKEASGFIYFVPSIGATKAMEGHTKELTDVIEMLKQTTNIPVAIGFGINTVQQAEFFSKMADGIIIGNAIVKIVEKYGKDSANHVFDYVKDLKSVM
ncbi:MAG: tryptophan synthase subunit alpha [Candidatus Gastranaerophilales bacterium]|nr:tryptophan synthase subunit alpha [Candidatus Gastranaerophilales bacterium]